MSEVFLKIINMSISASWLVLAVLILRPVFRKVPKWVNVLLWGIVGVRLICPFSFESALSLIPSAEVISPTIMTDKTPSVQTGVPVINSVINPVIDGSFAPAPEAGLNPLQIWIPVLSIIWLTGAAVLLLYTAVSYWRLRRRVDTAVCCKDNIFRSENVSSPFVLGLIKPRIYLPLGLDERETEHVVAHEKAHIRRKDHWWKPAGFLLLAVHWFNPLMWLAYALLCRDIELACDEKVIKGLDSGQRADYTQALLTCSVSRRVVAACPLAFGEVGVKARVKSVMNYKKPAFWVIIAAVAVCVAVAVCFLTDPAAPDDEEPAAADSSTPVDEQLAALIDGEIASHNQTKYSGDNFCCLDWEVIGKETSGDLTTVYMWALYKEYSNDGGLKVEAASHLFTVITAKKENGSYVPEEYWVPEDGSGYSDSIRKKVPAYLRSKAMDSERYIDRQSEKLEKRAKEHFGITESGNAGVGLPDPVKWFDYLESPDEMNWHGFLEIRLPEFPDVTFRWSYGQMEAAAGGETVALYTGMPIWSAYFYDLTGDGLPELCSTLSMGSGLIDNRVIVYDYANGASYSLQDRGVYDYVLRQGESDGQLYVEKSRYPDGEAAACGRLAFQDGALRILGEIPAPASVAGIEDPHKD
ncbi:MAG: M56 family metallopeptidase [Clostridiales bacterium]|nr:M56 family metallopeptidase [Clostridiales bacterium]